MKDPAVLLTSVAVGAWLAAVGAQALAHLVKYGLVPLPAWLGRVDFTPRYYLLATLLFAAVVAARWGSGEPAAPAKGQNRVERRRSL